MRVAYAGTAGFGALVLQGLLEGGEPEIALVVTRPDRPRGRHGTPQPSAVKEVALAAGLPLLQPDRLADEAVDKLLASRPEVFVVCAYGEIVGPEVLDRLCTVVVHPSAVPHWRGAAPVQRALMAGETELGVVVLKMSPDVDAGPVGARRTVEVPPDADAGEAFALLAPAATEALLETLESIAAGTIEWRPQVGRPTYAAKLGREDRLIDWSRPARETVDRVRALSPAVGARTVLGGRELIVWRAAALDRPPEDKGSESSDRLVVPTGEGYVEILELQLPGGRRQATATFLRGAGRWLTAG